MVSLNVQAAEPHIVLPPGYVIEIDWSDFSSAQGIMGKAKF